MFYAFAVALELILLIVNVLNAVPVLMLLSFPTILQLAACVLLVIGFYGKKDMLIIIGYAGLSVKYLVNSLWLAKLLYLPAWLLALGISVVCLTDQMQNMKKGLSRFWVLPAVLYALAALLEQFMLGFTYGNWDGGNMALTVARVALMFVATYCAMMRLTHPDTEEARKLRMIEEMYRHGDLSFAEYDVLKAKYTGTQSFAEQYGLGFTMAVSDKMAADRAVEQHQKSAQNRMITNTAIGNAVGGLGGGINAAVNTANRINAESAQLLAQQELANQRYREALEKSVTQK